MPRFEDDDDFELQHAIDMARADVVITADGPRFIEFNVGGGFASTWRAFDSRCVVDEGRPLRRAAERFQVLGEHGETMGRALPGRGRAGHGRPVIASAHEPGPYPDPDRTADHQGPPGSAVGPARIAFLLRLAPSTVHRVLTRFGLARLAHLDRATAQPVRRYEEA